MYSQQEELCSDSVERIVVNPNAAYDKFKDKRVGTKGLGQCCNFLIHFSSCNTAAAEAQFHLALTSSKEGFTVTVTQSECTFKNGAQAYVVRLFYCNFCPFYSYSYESAEKNK